MQNDNIFNPSLLNKFIFLFSIKISPFVGETRPSIIPMVVVFPHPLGPNNPTVLFLSILKLTSFTAKYLL